MTENMYKKTEKFQEELYLKIPNRNKPFLLDTSLRQGLEDIEGIGKRACEQFGVEYVTVVAGKQQFVVKR